jgi:oligopeptide/dipeptide ABC transporter ATP-binding protein
MLDIQDLTVTYSETDGTRLPALENVSLQIGAGEIIGVLGESGCGKSTLANAVLGLLPKAASVANGRIYFHENDLVRMSEAELSRIRGSKIALVPQDPALALNPVLTVGTQIGEVLSAHIRQGREERQDKILHLLRELGFDHPEQVADAYPHQLSGGQRQRISLAQAIACEPKLLIADEPTSKLDPSLRSEISQLLLRLHENHRVAMMLISHDVALIASLAHRIVMMYSGHVVETAPRAAMLAGPLHPYGQELLELARTASAMARFHASPSPGVPVETKVKGCCFEPRCRERKAICASTVPPNVQPEPERTVGCFKYVE